MQKFSQWGFAIVLLIYFIHIFHYQLKVIIRDMAHIKCCPSWDFNSATTPPWLCLWPKLLPNRVFVALGYTVIRDMAHTLSKA